MNDDLNHSNPNQKENLLINTQNILQSDSDLNLPSLKESSIEENPSKIKENIHLQRKAIIFAILSQLAWALNVIAVKMGSKVSDKFSANNYSMWRSVGMTILTYYNIQKKNQRLIKYSEIKCKIWFLIRTFGNYFCYNALILSIVYLRAATASCIAAGDPFVIIFLSVFIRHEKFYMRYVYGIIVCFIGTAIILLNEKHGGSESVGEKANIPLGLFFGICHFIIDGTCVFSQKIIVSEGISTDVQVFYTGLYNFLTALFVCFFTLNFGLSFLMILVATINSFIFYYAQYLTDKALQIMDVANYSPSAYVQTLFTFILGVIFFGESFYLSDAFGSFLIVAFHVYNAYDPL